MYILLAAFPYDFTTEHEGARTIQSTGLQQTVEDQERSYEHVCMRSFSRTHTWTPCGYKRNTSNYLLQVELSVLPAAQVKKICLPSSFPLT